MWVLRVSIITSRRIKLSKQWKARKGAREATKIIPSISAKWILLSKVTWELFPIILRTSRVEIILLQLSLAMILKIEDQATHNQLRPNFGSNRFSETQPLPILKSHYKIKLFWKAPHKDRASVIFQKLPLNKRTESQSAYQCRPSLIRVTSAFKRVCSLARVRVLNLHLFFTSTEHKLKVRGLLKWALPEDSAQLRKNTKANFSLRSLLQMPLALWTDLKYWLSLTPWDWKVLLLQSRISILRIRPLHIKQTLPIKLGHLQ